MENAQPRMPRHRPRAVALVGPYGGGKTTLFEALLESAGVSLRRPRSGRTHVPTQETRLAHCSFLDDSWAVLDCPGSVEFAHETACAVAIADLAVVVAEPDPARAIALRPVFRMLESAGVPFIVFVNKVDALDCPPDALVAALQAESAVQLVPRQMPISEGGAVVGYVDLLSERAYRYRPDTVSERIGMPEAVAATEQSAHDVLVDTLADRDDALLEQVIGGEAPSASELYGHFRKDLEDGSLAGVMFGAAEHAHGVLRLWKALRHDTPDPMATAVHRGVTEDGPPIAQVFRSSYGGPSGKLSLARVWRGALRDGATIGTGDGGVRIGGITRYPGGEAQKAGEVEAGEVVALGRLDGVSAGAVLGEGGVPLPFPVPPPPLHATAIAAAERRDDVKLSGALDKLLEEDPSLVLTRDAETGDTLLAGQGEIHLNHALERLGRLAGLAVSTMRPRVRFKETIRKSVHEHARLRRQTGGHGQFADVKLEIEPRGRGEGFLFTDRVVGGAVPRQYIGAVADAAAEATRKGPFGYPVVDIGVTLVDGGFHAVDSSDMAFRSATRAGMAEGLSKADPVLLEPIHRITVSAPNGFTANVQRLLSGRRGQILGYGERPGWTGWDDTEALVPEAELYGMTVELRSQTAGLGSFVHGFAHLAEAPARLVDKIAREAAGA